MPHVLDVQVNMLQCWDTSKSFLCRISLIKEAVFTPRCLKCSFWVNVEAVSNPLLSSFPPSLRQPFILHHTPSSDRGEDPGELHIGGERGGEGGAEREESVF